LTDASVELTEVIWEIGEHYGQRLTVPQQVAVARELGTSRSVDLNANSVHAAFARHGLPPPPAPYVRALVRRIKSLRPPRSLRDILTDYRQFAIRSLSERFGGKAQGHEGELRDNLLTYLQPRGYTEAHSGKGRTDILLPTPPTIIETKVWSDVRYYEDGLEELGRYIHTERPTEAYMVVFGDREPLPPIVSDHRQVVAEERTLEGLVVPVILIPFEVDAPSRAAANTRRRARSGR
jgi:hypothetical protein